MRGLVHFRLGQVGQAAKDFERSVSLDPNNHVFLNNRGFFSFKTGKHEDALQDFLKALSVKEDYAIAQINIEAVRNRMSARELLQTD
jgi:Tfp pilus assembly protein PilF